MRIMKSLSGSTLLRRWLPRAHFAFSLAHLSVCRGGGACELERAAPKIDSKQRWWNNLKRPTGQNKQRCWNEIDAQASIQIRAHVQAIYISYIAR